MAENTVKKERSRAYPFMPLEEALVRIASINNNLGLNGKFNRDTIATGMGYNGLNGASARTVAALTHYGFLEREKDLYTLSELARKYLMPVEDNDTYTAMRTAALSPTLFSEIYNAFKGQVTPKQFANRLVHEFGIQQKVAPEVERIFKETMQTAGILKDNNTLSQDISGVEQLSEQVKVPSQTAANGQNTPQTPASTPSGYLTVKLPSGLIVEYEQHLAPAFAFGQFGTVLKDLDDAVTKYLNKQKPPEKLQEQSNEQS